MGFFFLRRSEYLTSGRSTTVFLTRRDTITFRAKTEDKRSTLKKKVRWRCISVEARQINLETERFESSKGPRLHGSALFSRSGRSLITADARTSQAISLFAPFELV